MFNYSTMKRARVLFPRQAIKRLSCYSTLATPLHCISHAKNWKSCIRRTLSVPKSILAHLLNSRTCSHQREDARKTAGLCARLTPLLTDLPLLIAKSVHAAWWVPVQKTRLKYLYVLVGLFGGVRETACRLRKCNSKLMCTI